MNLTCRTCRLTKSSNDFYRQHVNRTGYTTRCKECTREANRRYAELRREGQALETPPCKVCGKPTARATNTYCSDSSCQREREREQWRRKNRKRAQLKHEGKPRKACTHCGTDRGYKHGDYCSAQECQQASRRTYKQQHAERIRATRIRNKAKRRGVRVETVKREHILERDQWTCGICRNPIPRSASYPDPMSPSLDHVVPIADGGEHSIANTQAAHLECNVRKGRMGEPQQLALC